MENREILFQRATDNDWDAVVSIFKTQIGNRYYHSETEIDKVKEAYKNSVINLINFNGHLAGLISYEMHEEGAAEVNEVVVMPEFQNRGIGRFSMEKVLDEVKTNGAKSAWLVTHPENSPAIVVYLKSGFKINKWIDNAFGDGEPRIRLEKSF